jgi:hypothetical protein
MDDFEARPRDDAGRVRGDAFQKEIVTSFVLDQHEVEDSSSVAAYANIAPGPLDSPLRFSIRLLSPATRGKVHMTTDIAH